MQQTPQYKIDLLRADFLDGCPTSVPDLALRLGMRPTTIRNYRRMFKTIVFYHPNKLQDDDYMRLLKQPKAGIYQRDRAIVLNALLPEVMDAFTGNTSFKLLTVYQIYCSKCANPYSYNVFLIRFLQYRKDHHICSYHHLRIKHIPAYDLSILKRWRKFSYYAANFKNAFAILASYEGMHLRQIANIVDSKIETVMIWFMLYKHGGIPALIHKKHVVGVIKAEAIKTKQDNLLKVLHQPPKNFNINRASWRLEDLANVYADQYGKSIGESTVKRYLKLRNYGLRKSKESLTSTDPKFREKLDFIKAVLSKLGSDEAFFSIDEYGHFGVKIKGGRSFIPKNELKIVPQIQKSKGVLLVTAALELGTNQVTHFYSKNKNTEEMIKLIELLRTQYHNKRILYLSWDGASWHNSKILKAYVKRINMEYGPNICLAPLPTSAQFLNVIESVFSGLARAVIHNSNYATVEDCMYAIDRHFDERNAFFQANPKQAGKIIWGKELVMSQFDELNQCDIKK
jgi:transposase